jgi:nitroimidazol reductase NimA-like FMN-containing flavoprotein (pyridoxamine 5'-phosphate oxidase superfamily)
MRGSHDRAVIDAILDEALICHIGFATGDGPIVLPTTHVRVGDQLYVHGSAASHMLGALGDGIEACVTVTLLDALVLARAAMHHSVNYRSVVVFGRAAVIDDPAAKRAALAALIDRVAPRRSAECRAPNTKELVATTVLALPIAEASAKIRTGPPIDDPEDAELPYWAGIIPLHLARGTPIKAP